MPRAKLLVFAPLWLLALGLAAWVAYGWYRHANPIVPPPFPVCEPHPRIGQALKPGFEGRHRTEAFEASVKINSLGWRSPETTRVKPEGVFRVGLFGDSFTFGWGVEEGESFAGFLREWWKARSPSVEVMNFGVPGWSPDHVLALLRNGGFEFAPDLIVIQLCVNDLPDLAGDDLELDVTNLPVAVTSKGKLSPEEYREALQILRAEYGLTPERLLAEMTEPQIHDFVRKVLEKSNARKRANAGDPPTGEIPSLPASEVARGLATGAEFQSRYCLYLAEAIERECAARGITVCWFLVDDGSADDERRAAWVKVREWFATLGDRFLDIDRVLPFAESADFFDGDTHWSSEGHLKVATALREWLERRLPPS
jgi:lysophospholipase L1-like esterase